MKRLVGMIFTVLIVGAPLFALGGEWYQGGSLHKATLGQWSGASYQDKLATSGDFVAAMRDRLNIELRTIEEIKPYAAAIVKCIDESAYEPQLEGQKVAEIAAACAILMGW